MRDLISDCPADYVGTTLDRRFGNRVSKSPGVGVAPSRLPQALQRAQRLERLARDEVVELPHVRRTLYHWSVGMSMRSCEKGCARFHAVLTF